MAETVIVTNWYKKSRRLSKEDRKIMEIAYLEQLHKEVGKMAEIIKYKPFSMFKEFHQKIVMKKGMSKYPVIWDILIEAGTEVGNLDKFFKEYKYVDECIRTKIKLVKEE